MKVFAILLLSFVCISKGQAQIKAPYLPSGWKPDGPAFELPSEIQAKSIDDTTADTTETIRISEVTQTETDGSQTIDETSVISEDFNTESRIINEVDNQISTFENQNIGEVVKSDSVTEHLERVTESVEEFVDTSISQVESRSGESNDVTIEAIENVNNEQVLNSEVLIDETNARMIQEEKPEDAQVAGFTEYGLPQVDISASAAQQIPVGFSEYGLPKEGETIQLLEEARLRRFAPKYKSTSRKH